MLNFRTFFQFFIERAVHVSPHNITDKFDLKFVGSGEGNSTYGSGLYFTSASSNSRPVSNYYADLFKDRGHSSIYKYIVEIDAKEEELLHWNKPIDEQSKYVTDRIKNAVDYLRKYYWHVYPDGPGRVFSPEGFPAHNFPAFYKEDMENIQYGSGGDFYKFVSGYYNSEKEASKSLLDTGVKGIQYYANSRGVPDVNVMNFVIFDDSIVKIIDKQNIKEMTDASVLGNDGPYDTSDTRIPAILGTISRRGKIKNKRRKRKR
jgi:hypothetical protein